MIAARILLAFLVVWRPPGAAGSFAPPPHSGGGGPPSVNINAPAGERPASPPPAVALFMGHSLDDEAATTVARSGGAPLDGAAPHASPLAGAPLPLLPAGAAEANDAAAPAGAPRGAPSAVFDAPPSYSAVAPPALPREDPPPRRSRALQMPAAGQACDIVLPAAAITSYGLQTAGPYR